MQNKNACQTKQDSFRVQKPPYHALFGRVAQEGTESTRVQMLANHQQQVRCELEGVRVLMQQLIDSLQPLLEDGRTLLAGIVLSNYK